MNPNNLAIAAASQAANATAELIRFSREGAGPDGPFQDDTVLHLADALKMTIEVQDEDFMDDDLRQLHGAATRFLEGWAG